MAPYFVEGSQPVTDLSIIVVSWNTKDLLADCLNSVIANSRDLSLQIIVVDNGSADGSAAMVRSKFSNVQLIENQANLGFAAANNLALPLCTAEYVLLLNPDTRIIGQALSILAEFLREHPQVGAVGPKVVHPLSRFRTLSCGHQPTIRTVFNHYFFLSRLFPESPAFRGYQLLMGVHDREPRAVEWLSGVCLMVRRQVIEQVGPLREDWFMYAEDLEWCERISAGGWELVHVPAAIVEHHQGASVQQNEAVHTMWVQSLKQYFVMRTQATHLQSLVFSMVLSMGLLFRAVLYWGQGLVARQDRRMWQAESRRFWAYALAALQRS